MNRRPLKRTDDLDSLVALEPRFEDYEHVFDGWPYIVEAQHHRERILVLGTLQGTTIDGDPISRGSVVDEARPKEVAIARLKRTQRRVRWQIWLVPYSSGSIVRFWTHIGDTDRDHLARYVIVADEELVEVDTRDELMAAVLASG